MFPFFPPCAVLRINSCVGESNHQAFILALSIFLLTSVYGITLTLDTICRDRSVFTALFYCPGVYADNRWDMDAPHRSQRKREWMCREGPGLWFTARLGALTQNTGQALRVLGIPEIANTLVQWMSAFFYSDGRKNVDLKMWGTSRIRLTQGCQSYAQGSDSGTEMITQVAFPRCGHGLFFSFLFFFFFFFKFLGHTCNIWRFPSYGSNWSCSCHLYHSHSNSGLEPHLRPAPQLMAMPDP